jgi:hypothetical protein
MKRKYNKGQRFYLVNKQIVAIFEVVDVTRSGYVANQYWYSEDPRLVCEDLLYRNEVPEEFIEYSAKDIVPLSRFRLHAATVFGLSEDQMINKYLCRMRKALKAKLSKKKRTAPQGIKKLEHEIRTIEAEIVHRGGKIRQTHRSGICHSL